MSTLGKIRDWHSPHNDECPHNHDVESDCSCKRKVERKPFRTLRLHDSITPNRGHKTSPDIIIEAHLQNGLLIFREKGKRTRYETTVVKIYEGLRWRAAMVAAQEARAKRKSRKKR
jgi:hypothetical protein